MDMLKRAEQVQDITKANETILEPVMHTEFISENDYLAQMANHRILKITETLNQSEKMLSNLTGERIAIPMEEMFNQFSTHICDALTTF